MLRVDVVSRSMRRVLVCLCVIVYEVKSWDVGIYTTCRRCKCGWVGMEVVYDPIPRNRSLLFSREDLGSLWWWRDGEYFINSAHKLNSKPFPSKIELHLGPFMQLSLAENRFIFWMLVAFLCIDGLTILTWLMEILVPAISFRSQWTQKFDLTTDLLFYLFISRHTNTHSGVPQLALFGIANCTAVLHTLLGLPSHDVPSIWSPPQLFFLAEVSGFCQGTALPAKGRKRGR